MRLLSTLVYGTLVGVGVHRLFRRRNRDRVAILAYHGLHGGECDPLENFDGLLLHVDRFARQMRYLSRDYRVVPLEESLDPEGLAHRVVITFDDAYASVYTHAFPILQALRLPATVFVPTDFVMRRHAMWWDRLRGTVRSLRTPVISVSLNGTPRTFTIASRSDRVRTLMTLHEVLKPLDADRRGRILERLGPSLTSDPLRAPLTVQQMREMAAHEISFQSHTASHRSLGALSPEEIWQELIQSKRLLEAWVGREVSWLAYPFGETRPEIEHALARSGYRGAVTMREGMGHPDQRFRLPRLAIGDRVSSGQFAAAVSGLRQALTPLVRRLVRRG